MRAGNGEGGGHDLIGRAHCRPSRGFRASSPGQSRSGRPFGKCLQGQALPASRSL